MEAGWQGDHVGAAHCAPLAATYFNFRKTTIYGGIATKCSATSSSADGPGELSMDFDFTDDQESLRDAVRALGRQGLLLRAPARHRQGRRPHARGLRRAGRAGPDRPGRARGARRHGLRRGRGDGGDARNSAAASSTRPTRRARWSRRRCCRPRRPTCRRAWLPKIADASALVVLAHQERAARYRLNHVDDARQRSRQRLDAERRQERRAGRRRGRCLHRAGAHRRAPTATRRASACSSSPRARRAWPCAATRRRTAHAPPSSRWRTRRPR